MVVLTTKAKSLVASKDLVRCKLEIEGHMIEKVMNFKYLQLGINISSNRNLYFSVKQQIMQGVRISGNLKDVV